MDRSFSPFRPASRSSLVLSSAAAPISDPPRALPGHEGDGPFSSLGSRDTAAATSASMSPASNVLCNYCGKPGESRCKACKTPYCSSQCFKDDWDTHRHVCKTAPVDVAKNVVKAEATSYPAVRGGASPMEERLPETTSLQSGLSVPFGDAKASASMEKPEAQAPQLLTHKVGDKLKVLITNIESLSEIMVQKVENSLIIQDLHLKLNQHCSNVPAPLNFSPACGTFCCAQFSEDKQWYRAKVLAYLSNEHIIVGYIDFGNYEEVDLRNLRPISAELLAVPMQAIPCTLAGVGPVGEDWSKECVIALRECILNKILQIEILGGHDGKALVSMVDEESEPKVYLAELLISAGYVVRREVHTEGGQHALEEVSATQPQQACEPLVWTQAEPPSNNQRVAAQVCLVNNPGEFYCRFSKPTDAEQLKELESELKLHCEGEKFPFVPKVGEPCCAMSPRDGLWWRAMVQALSEDKATLKFVDYGYRLEVEKKCLRSITAKFLKLPFQAVCCWLIGAVPLESDWTNEARLWFQALVDGMEVTASVVSASERGYGVDLWSKDQNVAAALISRRLAVHHEEKAKEMEMAMTCPAVNESLEENEHSQLKNLGPSEVESRSKEKRLELKPDISPEIPSFPVSWNTVALPLDMTFKPEIAAVINPSLFYLAGPSPDVEKFENMRTKLSFYTTMSQVMPSVVEIRPAPGAACCAQFTMDNQWYRAVVLEAGESQAKVLCADRIYSETLPLSRILPIPDNLLELPFKITRCTLTGHEHFPAEWPEDFLPMFESSLQSCVFAKVVSFNGSANELSVTVMAAGVRSDLSSMIIEAMQDPTESSAPPDTTRVEGSIVNSAAAPDSPQTKSPPEEQTRQESVPAFVEIPTPTETSEPKEPNVEQNDGISAPAAEDPVEKALEQIDMPDQETTQAVDAETLFNLCSSLNQKVARLEQLMELQLGLIQHLVGQ